MKSDKGMSHIAVLVIIVLIIFLVIGGIVFAKKNLNNIHIETLKTNMLLIEWKVKNFQEKQKVEGEETSYIGTKLTEFSDYSIMENLVKNNIITNEEAEKYYVLEDSNMAELTLEITNEKNAYYIVNYETYDIIYSKGCSYKYGKKLYRLSEIENAKDEKSNSEEQNTENVLNETQDTNEVVTDEVNASDDANTSDESNESEE